MTLYWLTEWEFNGYDDSDWHAVIYDNEKNELRRELIGTTRGANCHPCTGFLLSKDESGRPIRCETDVPEETLLQAEKCLAQLIFDALKPAEHRDVFEPNAVQDGTRVKLSANHNPRRKVWDEEDCQKCNGTGKWVNPRNDEDKRNCFACEGTGKIKRNFRPLRQCKQCKHEFAPVAEFYGDRPDTTCPNCGAKPRHVRIVTDKVTKDSVGVVVSSRAHGKFYRNGYNQPNRFNTSVMVRLDDGRDVSIPLEKLRLEREPLTDEQLRQRSAELATHRNWYAPFRTARHGGPWVRMVAM